MTATRRFTTRNALRSTRAARTANASAKVASHYRPLVRKLLEQCEALLNAVERKQLAAKRMLAEERRRRRAAA